MTLSQRTILIIVSTFIALLLILATTSDLILLSSFTALEKAEMTSHTRHISSQINYKLEQLDASAEEIAERLRIHPLGGSGAAALFNSQFMHSRGVDLAAVYNSAGRLVTITGYDCDNNEPKAVSEAQRQELATIISRIAAKENILPGGIVTCDDSPLMLVFKDIIDSNGARRGIVAIGWFVDHVEIERILKTTGATIVVHDLEKPISADVKKAVVATKNNEIYVTTVNSSSIAGYFMLEDIFGKPRFMVRSVEKRTLYEHGQATIAYIVAALIIASCTLSLVMWLFVKKEILSRLETLTTKVQQISDLRDISSRVPFSGQHDELSTLAVSINSMLDSLENAEKGMRESEERYRMLFERAPDSIIIIGVEDEEAGRIVAANQAAADQHGYTLDEFCRLNIHDLNTVETNLIAADLTNSIVAGEWVTAELWHQKKDGTRFPIEIHAGLITIDGRKYILGFDRDITQRKINEETDQMYVEQIRLLNDELSRNALELAVANNELETFNYSVSHDMRGPLTRISGYCQLLLDDDNTLDPDVREHIVRIYESGIWLNDMIDALLQLAQVSRVQVVSENVNLSAIAEASLREHALEAPERSVRTHIEPDIVVAGDARLLKMAMINLLNNAWKYSAQQSEACIEFGARQVEGEMVCFVRDNGIGFDMKHAGKLFQVFTRLHDASQFSGTGIGLATVQRIIAKHGGRIWVEAEPGKGAMFLFTLPVLAS